MSKASEFRERLARALSERDSNDPFGASDWRRLKKFARVSEALPEGLFRRRASKRRAVSPMARLRAAEKVSEAMVKVASYGGGRASAVEQLDYISRDGTLEMETGDGDVIEDKEDIRALVDEWSKEFHQRKKGTVRNTIHMVVSAPAGSNPEAVLKAGRGFAEGTFGENHPHALVRHDDCAHPHVHIVARMRGEDGSLFRIEPGGFQELRERFAEQCREYGIEMNATPRQVRGTARGESMALRKMREAGRKPEVDKHTEAAVRAEAGEPTGTARQATARRREILSEEAAAHRALARKLAARAEQDPTQRDTLSQQAAKLTQLAEHLDEGGSPTRPEQVRNQDRERGDKPPWDAGGMAPKDDGSPSREPVETSTPKPAPMDPPDRAVRPVKPEPKAEPRAVESAVEKLRRLEHGGAPTQLEKIRGMRDREIADVSEPEVGAVAAGKRERNVEPGGGIAAPSEAQKTRVDPAPGSVEHAKIQIEKIRAAQKERDKDKEKDRDRD